jgi:hypothetical protein
MNQSILRAIFLVPQRQAQVQLIDRHLRHVFDIHLGNFSDSWKALRKVKEEEGNKRTWAEKQVCPDNVCQLQSAKVFAAAIC